jgi:hypothetical protein
VLWEQLAESMRKRIATGRLDALSEVEIQQQAEAAYNDSVKAQVC